jgi:hypothetical protein
MKSLRAKPYRPVNCRPGRVRTQIGVALSGSVILLTALCASSVLTTSSASADSCPNATFRQGPSANLPDCRAYEMVSPAFKFGQLAVDSNILGGSSVITQSLGAFGEANEDQGGFGSLYVTTRDPSSGWSARPLGLPASQYFGPSETSDRPLADVSHDFSKALVVYAPRSSKVVDSRFYTRQLDGLPGEVGPPLEVGPALPPAKVADFEPGSVGIPVGLVNYAGGSNDLSHILFELNVSGNQTYFLWPGDTSIEGHSLYEYAGVGNSEPKLVGVENNGPLASNAEAKLISQCGTQMGATEGNVRQHAVSTNGRTVFFTAAQGGCTPGFGHVVGKGPPADELYARIDGSKTVHISEPSREDCLACDTSAPANAHFRAASSDGSKVFFLSEQKLLAGAEGQSLYEYDFNAQAGQRVTLMAPKVLGVAQVSDDGSHVYLVSEDVLAGNMDARNEEAKAEDNNLYVYDTTTGRTVFVAALASSDAAARGGEVDATPDGRFLLLASKNDLTPDAEGGGSQLYRYDTQEERLIRISTGERRPGGYLCPTSGKMEEGFNCDGNTGNNMTMPVPGGGEGHAQPQAVSISDDGSYVFFSSYAGLTPRALNNVIAGEPCNFFAEDGKCVERIKVYARNAYEYHEGQVYLISDGQDTHVLREQSTVNLIGATPSGSDVFFGTADQLLLQDTDTQQDVYDARMGGGFPAPATPGSCQGEACQGPLSGTPSGQMPGSTTFSGPGNPAPPTSKPAVKPKPKALTRAQKLAKARRACRTKHDKHKRQACEKQARKRYGPTKAKKASHTTTTHKGGK